MALLMISLHLEPGAVCNCKLYVHRVGSAGNIADLPSRESYALLSRMGAEWFHPVLNDAWFDPSAWLSHRRP